MHINIWYRCCAHHTLTPESEVITYREGGINMAFIGMIFVLMMFYVVVLIIIAILFIISVIKYILESMFLYSYSKRTGRVHPLTAWIPIYNKCILGRAAGKETQGKYLCASESIRLGCHAVICMGAYIEANAADILPKAVIDIILLLIVLLAILSLILSVYLVYHIMKKVMPGKADLLTILNVFTLGISCPIILFLIRNNDKLIITPNQREMTQL